MNDITCMLWKSPRQNTLKIPINFECDSLNKNPTMEQQTNKKTKQTNKGLSSLSKLVKIDLYQICLEQKRRKEVQTMSRLKCTLAGKCGWQIPSLSLITLLVCTSLHHICPSQIWCIFFFRLMPDILEHTRTRKRHS